MVIAEAGWRPRAVELALPLGAIVVHLALIGFPFVNQETAFNNAATYFATGKPAAIQAFFESEANTLVVPALGSLLASALHIDVTYGCRLLSILCIAALGLSIPTM